LFDAKPFKFIQFIDNVVIKLEFYLADKIPEIINLSATKSTDTSTKANQNTSPEWFKIIRYRPKLNDNQTL